MIFDTYGVPVWWLRTPREIRDASLLPDGDVSVTTATSRPVRGLDLATLSEYRLDGSPVRTFSIPGGLPTDEHELQVLPNGDYVLLSVVPRAGVNLSRYGGPIRATVLDAVIAEVSRRGRLVWSWSSRGHIKLAESRRWYKPWVLPHPAHLANGQLAYDIFHANAVAPTRPRVPRVDALHRRRV